MRRGVSLYQLERYGDAAFVFGIVEEKTKTGEEKDKSEGVKAAMAGAGAKKNAYAELPIWMAKVRRKLNELGEGHEQTRVSIVEFPEDVHVPSEKELKAQWEALKAGKSVQQTTGDSSAGAAASKDGGSRSQPVTTTEQITPSSAPAAPAKVRHEWYQSQDSVVVTLYVKGIPKDSVEAELKDDSVCVFPASRRLNILILSQGISPIPTPLRRRVRLHPRPALCPHRSIRLQSLRDEHQNRNHAAQASRWPKMERLGSVHFHTGYGCQ